MRTLGQFSFVGLAGACSLAFLAGCADLPPGPDGAGAGTGSGGVVGSGSSAGVGGTVGSGSTGSGGEGGQIYECEPGIPVSSQVPRMKNAEYDNVVKDLLGVTELASGAKPSSLLIDDYDGSMNSYAWEGYTNAAEQVAAAVMADPAKLAMFRACDPAAVATCYEDTIAGFGRKAFRRVVTSDEVTSFMRLTTITPAGTTEQITEALLTAILMSPSFIMLPELGQVAEGTSLQLTQHEIATRLSFLLWDSTPDQLLNDAADQGMLTTKEQILAQANRLILDRERTAPALAAYHRAYLDIRPGSHWWSVDHDTTVFPEWSDAVIEPMQEELDLFFEEVAFNGGQFKDLFLSNAGFVNNVTAPFYGLNAADYGPELEPVTLEASQRPGFLTRAGFLSSFSSKSTSSPILRGAFITLKILGVDPGPPDPAALTTPVPPGVYTTNRAMVEALTSPAKCFGCHNTYINPPGFVLENFDSVGKWQINDALGDPINPVATVTVGASAKPINNVVELMTELGLGADAKRNYAQTWVKFATGRAPNKNDACLVNDLNAKLAGETYTILNLLADLTQADSFRLRTRGN